MSKRKFIALWVGGIVAALVAAGFIYFRFVLDREGRPFCHKAIMIGFMSVMHEAGGDFANDSEPFPNVKGLSKQSLATILESTGDYRTWFTNYNYVPGLREDDPGELVLLYFNRPTRWTWHAPPPTRFEEKKWIIVPVDFAGATRPRCGPGENSERVSQDEVVRRLRRTLDYIRTNERPNWQTVVEEHTRFLDSIEHANQK